MPDSNTFAQHFTEMLEQDKTVAIPTGFKQLDSILNGGIRTGLYVIGGVPSIGKTSFVLQIADNIVANGSDVLYFNIEQSGKDLFAKSVSRETYKKNKRKCLSASEILYNWESLTATQKKAVQEAQTGLYNKVGETIYYYDRPVVVQDSLDANEIRITKDSRGGEVIQGAKNKHKDPQDIEGIQGQVIEYILTLDKAPVVIIDYLQILQAPTRMASATDKQIADYNILTLKKLCIQYNVPIIAISSFSRTYYDKPVSMDAFKETGAIEYSADVLIGLQYQMEKTDKKDRQGNPVYNLNKEEKNGVRKVEAVILKNRMGKLDDTPLKFDYLPEYNYFKEVKK